MSSSHEQSVEELVAEWESLLDKPKAQESELQQFLEEHSRLLPLKPFVQNHDLHLDAFISKFPIDDSLITDFAYLTKSSEAWWFVLVEIEAPYKPLFTKSSNQVTQTATLTSAMAQIQSWRDFVARHSNQVVDRIRPLLGHMASNKVCFKYVLIIGRAAELTNHQARIDRWDTFSTGDVRVRTWDSVTSEYRNSPPSHDRNILSIGKPGFRIKRLHGQFGGFAHLTRADLTLTLEQREQFVKWGYEIEKWEAGSPLAVSGKYAMEGGIGKALSSLKP